ncbi:DUF6443 domain-containing protein [Empedobacter brevis]
MRKLLLLFSLFSVNAFAQTKTENYTMETVCLNGNCTEKIQTIKYLDGLGREIQSISNSFNPNLKALVNLTEYDSLGRQAREYLPMAVSSTLEFQPGLNESAVKGYYNGLNLYGTDANYVYAETKFENNPLQRKIKTSAPGESWKMDGGHEIRYAYAFNSAADHVKKFDLSTTYHTTEKIYINSLTATPTVYPQNMLYKTIIRNENWQSSDGNTNNLTEKYTDKEGQVVLERKFNQGIALNTYYIYDVYGNLAYVLPPLLSEKGTITTTLLNNLGYQYRYDSRNRLVQKMEPGKLWESIVYDKNDRVVYTQSANQTNQEWSFIKYDKYGRVVYSGLHTSSATRLALQNELNGSTVNFEQKSTGSFQNNGLNNIYYTNAAFPKTNMTVLIVNYYDTYENTGVTFPTAAYHTIVNDPSSKKLKGLGTTSFVNILGTTTWNKTYNFYEQDYLRSVATEIHYPGNGYTKSFFKLNYVDQPTDSKVVHKRPNSSEAERIIEEHFDYDDLLRLTKHTHQVNSGKLETLAVNRYDDLGRLTSKKVGNTEVNPLQTIDYKYNIRGWMTDLNNVDASLSDATRLFAFKISYDQLKYGSRRAATATGLYNGNISQTFWKSSSNNTLRSYDYSYDGINQLTDAIFYKGTGIYAKNYYNENITYDNNGNITTLQRNGDNESGSTPIVIDNLQYSYISNTNKLSYVTDLSAHPSGFNTTKTGILYEYDDSGNLKKDNSKDIVEIRYNHLNLVTEVLWLNGSSITFVYDATGKKVQKKVSKTNPGSNPIPVRTDYLNGFQYKNGSLQFFPTAEGYVNIIVKDNTEKLSYVYNYRDHLGNTRVSYAWDEHENKLKTIAENHYYPYGLQHNGYQGGRVIGELDEGEISYPKTAALPGIDIGTERMSYSGSESYAYHYNGNEFQSELGMNWYDMNLRMYDPALARWMVQDPVIHYTKSTYNAFDNNPVYFADPSGADAEGGETPDPKLAFGVPLSSVMRTSSVETTIQGKNTNNAIINFRYKEESGKFNVKDFKKAGWDIINVDTTEEAVDKIGNRKFNNLMLFTHGGIWRFDDGTSESGIFLNSTNNENTWADRLNWVTDSDVTKYQLNVLTNFVAKYNIENLISLGKSVNNGKNFIFMACDMAYSNTVNATFFSQSIGNNVDVFMNRDKYSSSYTTYLDTGSISVEIKSFFNKNMTLSEHYEKGWLKANSGNVTNIKNIQINENGVKVIK